MLPSECPRRSRCGTPSWLTTQLALTTGFETSPSSYAAMVAGQAAAHGDAFPELHVLRDPLPCHLLLCHLLLLL